MVHDLRVLLRELRDARASPARSSWTAARCNPRRNRAREPATTEPSGARAPRCTWRSIRWGTCWRCTSPRPMSRIVSRWKNWHRPCRSYRSERGVGVCGSGLHRRDGCTRRRNAHGIQLEVVKHPEAKRGFVLLPRRWVVERSFAWAARFRRLARDYERLAQNAGRVSLPRLRLPHASSDHSDDLKFITGSNAPFTAHQDGRDPRRDSLVGLSRSILSCSVSSRVARSFVLVADGLRMC